MNDSVRKLLIVGGIALVLVVVLMNAFSVLTGSSAPASRELVYVIPEGANAQYGLGAGSTIFPNEINLTLGKQDTLVIRNEDIAPISVAGVLVQPGQVYRQQFTRSGTFDLECSVHIGDRLRVVVSPPL